MKFLNFFVIALLISIINASPVISEQPQSLSGTLCIKSGGADIILLLQKIERAFLDADYEGAAAYCHELIDILPHNRDALLMELEHAQANVYRKQLAVAYSNMGDYERAFKAIIRAHKLKPDPSDEARAKTYERFHHLQKQYVSLSEDMYNQMHKLIEKQTALYKMKKKLSDEFNKSNEIEKDRSISDVWEKIQAKSKAIKDYTSKLDKINLAYEHNDIHSKMLQVNLSKEQNIRIEENWNKEYELVKKRSKARKLFNESYKPVENFYYGEVHVPEPRTMKQVEQDEHSRLRSAEIENLAVCEECGYADEKHRMVQSRQMVFGSSEVQSEQILCHDCAGLERHW